MEVAGERQWVVVGVRQGVAGEELLGVTELLGVMSDTRSD